DTVAAGDPIAVVSAMKMETVIVAPAGGEVAAVGDLRPGDAVTAGQIVAVITEAAVDQTGRGRAPEETWDAVLGEIRQLQALAHERLAPGSDEPGVVRQ